MRIIAHRTLVEYGQRHPETVASLNHFYRIAKSATWKTPGEAAASFSKAKVLDGTRVRYEVAGGNYRLIMKYNFAAGIGYVRFLGTHAEYDRIDALTI